MHEKERKKQNKGNRGKHNGDTKKAHRTQTARKKHKGKKGD